MREITSHQTNECNQAIRIRAAETANGEVCCHYYALHIGNDQWAHSDFPDVELVFQHGPIKDVGVNGITNEVLLAIVIDRLTTFQAGRFACDENADALSLLEDAMRRLHDRTKARAARGVEGTHDV